jgi:alkylation response protein AidB-like acyl-CoA dehydrogenase
MPETIVLLDPPELLAQSFSAALDSLSPEPLAQLPAPEAGKGYRRVTLSRNEDTEVAATRWRAGGQSSLHGHAESAALYCVVAGAVEEERYLPEGDSYRYEKVIIQAGGRSYLPPGAFHCVRALEGSVVVHTYAPAPDDATSAVPEETLRLLDQARRRGTRGWVRATGKTLTPRRTPDLVAVVRGFLDGWAESEAASYREGGVRLPERTLEEMRGSSLLGAPMPAEFGGWDCSMRQAVTAVRLLAQRAPAAALALAMPLGNAATTRIPAPAVSRAQRPALLEGQRWIATQVARGKVLAVANSEPGAGGELSQTKTTARLGDDGVYRLTGRKSFATFGPDADYFLCAARRPETHGGKDVVDGFFIARHAPGLVVDDRWDPVGMRPTASVGLTLDGTPAEAILGYPGCLEGINARHWSTILFAAVFLGVGEGALREAVRQAPGDGAWARSALADCALNLDAAAGFVETVAREESWPLPAEAQERARRAKTFAARTAVETAVQGAVVSGGRCYTPGHPVFRFLCDALAGPLLRPPLPKAMDAIAGSLFAPADQARAAA